MDIRQSDYYANYMRSLGWVVEKIDDTNVFIKKILFFSIIKIQHPNKLDSKKLSGLQKKYRAVFTNIEPGNGWHLLPTKTTIIDLQNLHLPKDTRYEIRRAAANNLIIKPDNDVEKFYQLLQETMKRGRWSVPLGKEVANLYRSFQPDNGIILMCYSRDNPRLPLSGCLLIWFEETAHYMYAANNREGLRAGGAYFVLDEAIKFCQQKLGLKYLDLEGIYDNRYPHENKGWQGFTNFKLGWGGKTVEY